MDLISVILLAVGLSMDAFAAAVCKGLGMRRIAPTRAMTVGFWFGAFQGLMPMLGYLLGAQFERFVSTVSPWVAFILLTLIGVNMIREALSEDGKKTDTSLDAKEMFLLAIATSIDAFAVGITYAMAGVNIAPVSPLMNAFIACLITACVTFMISAGGVWIGGVFGGRFRRKAAVAGGVILILIGIEILMRRFGVI